jgi:hypothetical protein
MMSADDNTFSVISKKNNRRKTLSHLEIDDFLREADNVLRPQETPAQNMTFKKSKVGLGGSRPASPDSIDQSECTVALTPALAHSPHEDSHTLINANATAVDALSKECDEDLVRRFRLVIIDSLPFYSLHASLTTLSSHNSVILATVT